MIFGADDRQLLAVSGNPAAYPFRAVVHLTIDFPLLAGVTGTGVMVGPNDVLTAAQLLYAAELGGYATAIRVTPGKDGFSAPYGDAFATTLQIDARWITSPPSTAFDYDYGLITLDRDIGLTVGWLPMHYLPNPVGVFIDSLGYPDNFGGRMAYTFGIADGSDNNTIFFTNDLDSSAGQSGAPAIAQAGSWEIAVVGVMSHENTASRFNGVLRLTDEYIANINFWANTNNETTGHDFIFGGPLGEFWDGISGNDTIVGMGGNDSIIGGYGDDDLNGNLGDDFVGGDYGNDYVRGGQGNDVVGGGDGDDWHVNGNMGNDIVMGGAGNDIIWGGPGNDALDGGPGSDGLSGDLGDDILTGGLGADLFYFAYSSGRDTITDFDLSQDRILLVTTHTKYAVQSGTFVDLGGGHGFTILNVSPGQLADFYFM